MPKRRTMQDHARRATIAAAAAGEAPDLVAWIPPVGTDSRMQPAGLDWDAVRATAHLARPTLHCLGDDTGAVIREPRTGDVYWLLPVGAAATWARLPDVDAYGPACWVEIPPQGRVTASCGPYWLRPPDAGRILTHPRTLHLALRAVIRELYPESAASLEAAE